MGFGTSRGGAVLLWPGFEISELHLQAMNAVREVMTDPLAAERWREHPRLGPLTRKVARLTLESRFSA